MIKRIFSMLLCLALVLCLLPVTVGATTEISTIELQGFQYLEANTPHTSCNAFTTSTKGISFYGVDWYDETTSRYLEGNEVFLADHEYSAQIWVEAEDGYAFKCIDDATPNVTATINGYEVEVSKAFEYKAFAMVVLTVYFQRIPAKGWIKSANLDVTAPVAGAKPNYTQIITDEYATKSVYFSGITNENMKNGIMWYAETSEGRVELSPETAMFADTTAYGFHCLLFPNEGYAFAPDAKVYVNGNTAEARLDYATFLSVHYQFPATGSSHTHTPSEWRTTQVYHYKVCTSCGDVLEQEDHKGGTATCQEKAVCTTCKLSYGQLSEDHTPDTKWTACGALYHAYLCKFCGAHCDPEAHKPGPAATDTTPQKCQVCDYIITPAKNHTHNLTPVEMKEPTCTQEGVKAHYTCDGCSQLFADQDGKEIIEDLSLPALKHDMKDGKCTRCGYAGEDATVPDSTQEATQEATTPEVTTGTEETEPTQPHAYGADEIPANRWVLWVFLGLLAVVIAVPVTVFIVIVNKKKKKAE